MALGILINFYVSYRIERGPTTFDLVVNFFAPSVASLVFIAILGYGVLKAQLFDIDLRILRTLRSGLVITVFLGVFLIAVSIAQNFFQGLGVVVGGIVTGLFLLIFSPIQRLADRLSHAAMPRVRESADYVRIRKSEVFKAALEGALRDGLITDRERDVLQRIQLELGIANQEARAMETEVRRALKTV